MEHYELYFIETNLETEELKTVTAPPTPQLGHSKPKTLKMLSTPRRTHSQSIKKLSEVAETKEVLLEINNNLKELVAKKSNLHTFK